MQHSGGLSRGSREPGVNARANCSRIDSVSPVESRITGAVSWLMTMAGGLSAAVGTSNTDVLQV